MFATPQSLRDYFHLARAYVLGNIANGLLRLLRWMVAPTLQVVVVPQAAHTSPRTKRRALGKLVAKGVTRGRQG